MLPRRELLRAAGATSLALTTGCDAVVSAISERLGAGIPERIEPPSGEVIDPIHHLLDRAAFGPWPGDIQSVRELGAEAWLEQQLEPESIDDSACSVRTAWIDVAHLPASLAFELRPEEVEAQLTTFTILQATYSRRQLLEVMVRFWSDHFNVAIAKSMCQHLRPTYDREVIRPHALGRFGDLLRAVSLSSTMLVYLDGRDNKVLTPGDRPNENQARELFELHGLGVNGGYTQRDVMEAARCLSGWTVKEKWAPGEVEFAPERHDDGEKTVLGHTIAAGGGARDAQRLFEIVTQQPSCARYLARKLCRWFVDDDPPPTLVVRAAKTFSATRGDIGSVLQTILLAPEFSASAGRKLKRPFRFVVSALRCLGADTHAREDLALALGRMGQPLFEHPTPDGYPMEPTPWLGTLLWRWNFALALSEGRLGGTSADLPRLAEALGAPEKIAAHVLGRAPTDGETAAFSPLAAEAPARALALLLCSPRFQRH